MKIGDRIDDYTLLYECGKGGFGIVFLAQKDDGRYVAFKAVTLLSQAGTRELQALESYRKCPDSCALLKIEQITGKGEYFYYTMELADNILGAKSKEYKPYTLAAALERFQKLNVAQTRELISQLLEGLSIIHANKLVHRDIKPANIIWVNGRAKLSDIGLLANDLSMTCPAGSDDFIPPVNSPVERNSAATDLYAITRLIFCCLTGKSAKYYDEGVDWGNEDIRQNGQDLLQIMLLSEEQIAQMNVADLRGMLLDKPAPYMSYSDLAANASSPSVSADNWIACQGFSKKDFLKSAPDNVRKHISLTAWLIWGGIILLILLFSAVVGYLFIQQKRMEEKHIVQPVQIDPAEMKKIDQMQKSAAEQQKKQTQMLNAAEDAERKAEKDLQDAVQAFFQRCGFLSDNGKLLPFFLNYEILSNQQMHELIWHDTANPRLKVHTAAPPRRYKNGLSLVEQELLGILTRDASIFDIKAVKARQDFWRNKSGSPAQIQKEMLSTDMLMQAVAIDAVIRSGINSILRNNKLSDNDKKELEFLFELRYNLLNPEIYKMKKSAEASLKGL